MEAALRTFRELKTSGRKIAVLGDMLELGAFSPESHRGVLRQAFGAGFDVLVLLGGRMRKALRALSSPEAGETHCFGDAAQAGVFLKECLKKGDAVLLKGSRAMGMEKILEVF
jgi:UDP-N-acetylmuramoyl-tripeptide--D-alanyl-D-alanine ligase